VMYGVAGSAVSTPRQAFLRSATMCSQCRLQQVNRLPFVSEWQAIPTMISASTLGVPAAGEPVPMRARYPS
jgi:hypothetical protein